jgi:hypothetical protein
VKRVIVESPYAGDVAGNLAYARACIRDCLKRGEAPIASHLLFTQDGILDDDIPDERLLGIKAGLAWVDVADVGVFYLDRGWSNGMGIAREFYERAGTAIEERLLPGYAAERAA